MIPNGGIDADVVDNRQHAAAAAAVAVVAEIPLIANVFFLLCVEFGVLCLLYSDECLFDDKRDDR